MSEPTLSLEDAQGLLRKISNNLLNFGKEKITAFTLPIEGIGLNQEQLDAFMGEYTFRSWFDQGKDGVWRPCAWWGKRAKRDFHVDEEFDCEAAVITVSGNQDLTFEKYEPKDGDEEASPAAKIANIVLTPQDGGIVLMSFHMQVRPGVGRTNLLLQEHQFRHVAITLGKATLAKSANKQQSLPLSPPGSAPTAASAPDPTVHWQHGMTGEKGSGPRSQLPGGCVEIDPPAGGESEAQQSAAQSPEDLEAFEESAKAQVAAFNAKPGEVVDGRSERVKHQDRRRGRGAH